MTQRDIAVHLFDILQACDHIQAFTSGKDLDEYLTDVMLRSAVERQFGNVGEALNRLRRDAPELLDHITASQEIIAFRNRLIHGYDAVNDETVWGVIHTRLPRLRQDVRRLLDQHDRAR